MRRSIRFRITAVAVLAVVAVLVVSGVALVVLQRQTLINGIDDALTERADEITVLVTSGAVPEQLNPTIREGFAQLVATDGTVVVATPNLAGVEPLTLDGNSTGDTLQTTTVPDVDDDLFRVLSRPISVLGVLHVGTTYEQVGESTEALTSALVVTVPAVAVALGLLVWWLVGRTLRPVEDIRAEVAEIESTDLHRRVPEPGSGDEVDRLARTMNEMLARLQHSVERQQQFVSDASHDLRSPLTRMRSRLEVALAHGDDEQAVRESLLEDVVDMQRMVEDLLYLARADEGRLEIDARPLDLDDVVVREVRRLESRQRVDVDYSRLSGAHVVGDAGQLARAVRNLLDNAERYASSTVAVSLSENDATAVLTVSDDGPGVAAQDAELIFERFARPDEARAADTGGTGLGLAIARDIIERHNGRLRLVRDGETGATFELSLPLTPR